MNPEFQVFDLEIPPELAGQRLDVALAKLLPQHSRTRIKGWIDAGGVSIGRKACKPRDAMDAGAKVRVHASLPEPNLAVLPEAIALSVAHEDKEVFVIDKPAGLVVHPGAGNREHTLQNALLALDPKLASVPRAGLIHRLDKDTSGLLLVARNETAQTDLTRQLMARTIARGYRAVVTGALVSGGTIDAPIGRNRSDRLRMAVRESGRAAVTHFRILERFPGHTYLGVKLETGRTHQIRLHLSHLKYPIVGDPVYGGRLTLPRGASATLTDTLRAFRRQALHAAELAFDQPRSGKRVSLESALPADFEQLLAVLRAEGRLNRAAAR